ncbi:MAG: hypothetical protein KJO30_06440 [Boseongicola sp.]|nr:hypothetical protein [Boseongicola sp.]
MTLALSLQTKDSVWLLTDHRLSAPGFAPVDTAVKATRLELSDGELLVGYAGIGLTPLGSQPSHWIASSFRGTKPAVNDAMYHLRNLALQEFPKHLRRVKRVEHRRHEFIASGFKDGRPVVYILRIFEMNGEFQALLNIAQMHHRDAKVGTTIPFVMTGSAVSSIKVLNENTLREVLRYARYYNRSKVSSEVVARCFFQIGSAIYNDCKDGSISPNFLVMWQNNKTGRHLGGGGAFEFDRSGTITPLDGSIPTIAGGMDINAIHKALFPILEDLGNADEAAESRRNAALASIPTTPDSKFR